MIRGSEPVWRLRGQQNKHRTAMGWGKTKSEIQSPKAIKALKSEGRTRPILTNSLPFNELGMPAVIHLSDFGLRISFGLRVSAFGFRAALTFLRRPVNFPPPSQHEYQTNLGAGASPASRRLERTAEHFD